MANIDNTPEANRKCSGCGAALMSNSSAPFLCPKCLLKVAMETQPPTIALSAEMLSVPKGRGLPQPGDQFGQYKISSLLGAGGMGAVYDAQDLDTGRRVALKILSHALDSPE